MHTIGDTLMDLTTVVERLDQFVDKYDKNEIEPELVALAILQQARRDLARIEEELTQKLAPRMRAHNVVVEGVGSFERHKKKNRTQWDKDALLSAVLDSRLFNPNTGELVEESPLERVMAVWNLGAPRTTALRDRKIDADEFCHVEDAGWSIQLKN